MKYLKIIWEWIKENPVAVIISGVICLVVLVIALAGGGVEGDGVTTCKNCGKKEVVLFGYCERCADGFLEWQKEQG